MIGGIVTSGILELLIYPVIYVIWRRRYLPSNAAERDKLAETTATKKLRPQRHWLRFLMIAIVLAGAIYGGSVLWPSWFNKKPSLIEAEGSPLATVTLGDLNATVYGELGFALSDLLIEFRDKSGTLVDVGTVKMELDMSMPGMTMHGAGETTPTGQLGQYRVKIKPDMAGDWLAKLSIEGPRGKAQASFLINIKP
jgi:hypothetical protein